MPDGVVADFVGCDFAGFEFTVSDFVGADLPSGADLLAVMILPAGAVGVEADLGLGAEALAGFAGTDLDGADFVGATLVRADLTGALDAGAATLAGAFRSDFVGIDFVGAVADAFGFAADFVGIDFAGADFPPDEPDFVGVDLAGDALPAGFFIKRDPFPFLAFSTKGRINLDFFCHRKYRYFAADVQGVAFVLRYRIGKIQGAG